MAQICPFSRATKTKASNSPAPMSDRELEFSEIIASAELAFDQVFRIRADMAA